MATVAETDIPVVTIEGSSEQLVGIRSGNSGALEAALKRMARGPGVQAVIELANLTYATYCGDYPTARRARDAMSFDLDVSSERSYFPEDKDIMGQDRLQMIKCGTQLLVECARRSAELSNLRHKIFMGEESEEALRNFFDF